MKYSRIVLYILWIGIFYLRGGGTIDEGWDFLFGVDKTYIREFDDVYSKSDIWHMQNGVWTLFGIAGFTFLLFKEIWTEIKANRAPSDQEQSDRSDIKSKTQHEA
mgnify:CR=1 FL=1